MIIKTGQSYIPLHTLIAAWFISAISLLRLVVSPIMRKVTANPVDRASTKSCQRDLLFFTPYKIYSFGFFSNN